MAITATIIGSAVPGNLRRVRAVVTGDTSYATGGYTITPALFGFQFLGHYVVVGPTGASTVAAEAAQNPANGKLLFLAPSGSEVTAATNVSAVSFYLEGYGN
jgi:hypothetical protein